MSRSPSPYPSASLLTTSSERDWHRAEGLQLEDVLVRGGRFLQDFTEAKLVGSSLGGGSLKQFGIYIGLRVELNVNGETVLTAPIFSISICPMELSARA